jgi:hypothetical protein
MMVSCDMWRLWIAAFTGERTQHRELPHFFSDQFRVGPNPATRPTRDQGGGAMDNSRLDRSVVMTLKLFAITSLAGLIIIGAGALASAAPSPSESGPYVTNSTTSMTSTTSNAPSYPGHMAY